MLLAKTAFKDFSPAGVNMFAVPQIFAEDIRIKTSECEHGHFVRGKRKFPHVVHLKEREVLKSN